jgi:N-acetylmuramoyl-L-alanine amidase
MANVGMYLNLKPHMNSWRVYVVGDEPVAGNEAGNLAPATFGGLSYRILAEPSANIFTIQTESFGTVNIYAPRDEDSEITSVPMYDNGSSPSGTGEYLNLQPHMNSWKVYPLGVSPVSGNEIGRLAPATFGGLSYRIIDNPSTNIYTIETESFGRVNIYAPSDPDSTITNSPQFSNGGDRGTSGSGTGQFLNLKPHMDSWRVYPIGVSPTSGNEAGSLAPSRYGGLSYEILAQPSANLYTIFTESFGRVNIYAPQDADSSFTSSPVYVESSSGNTNGAGLYLNLFPHINSWRVYPMGVSPVAGNEVGKLGPSLFGGLSYRILGTAGTDVYTISTESFGQVNIYAPRDNDSSITSTPLFGVSSGTPSTGGSVGSPTTSNPGGVKVFLDAGHGGHDPGAQGNGLVEKNVNLEIIKKVGDILDSKGANVIYRRYGDSYTTLDGIVSLANESDADLFISVHCNASGSSSARGTECYTYMDTQSTRNLAANISSSISSSLGIPNRGIHSERFRVITYTNMPAILIETGFLTNSSDAYQLRNNTSGFATAIANEIIDYLGIADGPPPPPEVDEEELFQEARTQILRNLASEFPLLDDMLPSSEFVQDQNFYKDYGTYEVTLKLSSQIKTLGSSSAKVTINDGEFNAEIAPSIFDKLDEYGNRLEGKIQAGTQGVAFTNIVNEGEVQSTFGVNNELNPFIKFVTNMDKIKIQTGAITQLSIEIEIVFDRQNPNVISWLPSWVSESLSDWMNKIALGIIGASLALEILVAIVISSLASRATSFVGTATELLEILEEEIRKENT